MDKFPQDKFPPKGNTISYKTYKIIFTLMRKIKSPDFSHRPVTSLGCVNVTTNYATY